MGVPKIVVPNFIIQSSWMTMTEYWNNLQVTTGDPWLKKPTSHGNHNGNHVATRLVNYYNLPIYIYIFIYIHTCLIHIYTCLTHVFRDKVQASPGFQTRRCFAIGHGLAVSLCRHRSFREALEHPRGEEKGIFYGKIRVFYGILWDFMGFYRI